MPPAPASATISYGPSFVPAASVIGAHDYIASMEREAVLSDLIAFWTNQLKQNS
jgi:hypothetical protein